jgi:hypothetical protein
MLYCAKHAKRVNALCGQNAVLLSVLKKVALVLTTVGSITFAQSYVRHVTCIERAGEEEDVGESMVSRPAGRDTELRR